MKVIYDCETELGKCDPQTASDYGLNPSEGELTLYAYTSASVTGRMVKIEHSCYFRQGPEVPEQPWVKPETVWEPFIGEENEMLEMVRKTHTDFLEKARQQISEEKLMLI